VAGLKAKLTKRTVDAVQPPTTGDLEVWDTELKGFCLRVTSKGSKSYALKYRLGSAQRWWTIGKHGSPWTPDTARDAARTALNKVADGIDPAADKRLTREALTVGALIDLYLEEGPATKPAKRASTWAIDGSNLKRHIGPLLGRKLAHLVTQADAARAVRDIAEGKTAKTTKTGPRGLARVTGGEGTARRTRTTAAALWAWGLEQGHIRGGNPFAGVKLTAAPVRERFLSRDEAGRFLDALAQQEACGALRPAFADALRLLILSGARKTEVLGLQWSEVDFERKVASLPPERTKAGGKTGVRRIHLSPAALAVLAKRYDARAALNEAERTAFVFPAAWGDGHAVGLRRAFVAVCKAAGLEGVRVHDLRHSFASFALADGASLFLIGKALGHANARTTERYAHLSGDPLADLAASVGARIVPEAKPIALTEGAAIPLRRA
jgi:integrase